MIYNILMVPISFQDALSYEQRSEVRQTAKSGQFLSGAGAKWGLFWLLSNGSKLFKWQNEYSLALQGPNMAQISMPRPVAQILHTRQPTQQEVLTCHFRQGLRTQHCTTAKSHHQDRTAAQTFRRNKYWEYSIWVPRNNLVSSLQTYLAFQYVSC